MKAEIYILGLFTFEGEDERNIVFSNQQLDTINSNIESNLGVNWVNQKSKWVKYHLDQQEIMDTFDSPTFNLLKAEMGYYHHRVIFRFIFEGEDISHDLREIREKLKVYTSDKIVNAIIQPNRFLGFLDHNIYQLLIVHEGLKFYLNSEDPIFSNDTTTMAFDITEPSKIWPVGKKYNIRISIPSTIIYTRSGVSDDFMKAMINSIYQYCLYEIKDMKKDQSSNGRTSEIGIGEEQLVHLWQHIIDTMGGRTLDKNIAKVSQTNYLLAFAAFIIALVAFDREKFSENWGHLSGFFTSTVKWVGSWFGLS